MDLQKSALDVQKPRSRQDKADVTTAAARQIISAEVNARESKTARLRAARLKAEEDTVVVAPEPKKKAAPRKRAPAKAPAKAKAKA